MNTTEEHPFDQLETAASQAIGLNFLLSRAMKSAGAHPGNDIGQHEKEGVEVLMLEVGTQLRRATDRIKEMTAEELRAHADATEKLEAHLAAIRMNKRAC